MPAGRRQELIRDQVRTERATEFVERLGGPVRRVTRMYCATTGLSKRGVAGAAAVRPVEEHVA